jgi:hypothetical protein
MENQTDKMSELDKITFELLLNKNQYNRYLSVTNPQKLEEEHRFFEKIKKYRGGIVELFEDFLEDPKKGFNNELNEAFQGFARTCIKYLENTDYEEKPAKHYYDEDEEDDDVLFDESHMDQEISADSLEKIAKTFGAGITSTHAIATGPLWGPSTQHLHHRTPFHHKTSK